MPDRETAAASEMVARRFYEQLCNQSRFKLAAELLSDGVRFRASLESLR